MRKTNKPFNEMKYILATDVGSTTTKARLFHKKENEWRFLAAGENPTTVEDPYEDVTIGVRNAIIEIEEITGHKLFSEIEGRIIVPYDGKKGTDLYCTTSSAGGGLQMMVSESANRAALGAGAIVMDVMAVDDDSEDYERIQRIRNLRPDMLLLAGGTDGGTDLHVMQMADIIKASKTKPRLGVSYKLPIVYAGNKDIHEQIKETFYQEYALVIVDNLRPVLNLENTEPARMAIHELFMEHVMSHAPGYNKLMKWTNIDIMPTPAGEGIAMQFVADKHDQNVLGVGLGGATTNIYSIVNGKFVRSVSANLGMSYSISNVMKETGIENITRWLPFKIKDSVVANRLMNKMIRPTIIPQTLENLLLEHAVAREALGLGLQHHKTIATRLKGTKPTRTIDNVFSQALEESYVKMMNIDIIVGTGGLLSHAPRRNQSLILLTDAFQPEGITKIFQDSVFMMPHLGVLSTMYKDAAWQIFDKDCCVRLGTVIAPHGTGVFGKDCFSVTLEMPDGTMKTENVKVGEIKYIKLPFGKDVKASISPKQGFDIGAGNAKKLDTIVSGGVVGVVLDGRGRPIQLPDTKEKRRKIMLDWFTSMDMYPIEKIEELI